MSEPDDSVVIRLERDHALAFFEWSYQFMTDHDPTFQHAADAIAVDAISSELERTLAEPFLPDYGERLAAARERAVRRYRELMGEGAGWIDELEYRTFPPEDGSAPSAEPR